MTVIARRIAAIPVRLATLTWQVIVDLLAGDNPSARVELLSVTGVAASLITTECFRESPMIVTGEGPRVRIYCVYGEKAIEGAGVEEQHLPESPVRGDDWFLSLPCPSEDLEWVNAALKRASARITARDAIIASLPEPSDEDASVSAAVIDVEAFLRP